MTRRPFSHDVDSLLLLLDHLAPARGPVCTRRNLQRESDQQHGEQKTAQRMKTSSARMTIWTSLSANRTIGTNLSSCCGVDSHILPLSLHRRHSTLVPVRTTSRDVHGRQLESQPMSPSRRSPLQWMLRSFSRSAAAKIISQTVLSISLESVSSHAPHLSSL